MMAPLSGREGDPVTQQAQLVDIGGVFLFHTHGAAPAANIAGQAKELLYRHQLHVFVSGGFGGLFQVQLAAHGDTEHVNAGFDTPGHQGFKNLLLGDTQNLSGMGAAEIVLAVGIKFFFAGNVCFFHKTDRICFC